MSEFNEGLIGKLQVRQSGKVQLRLGNVTLDLNEGTSTSFLQVCNCLFKPLHEFL